MQNTNLLQNNTSYKKFSHLVLVGSILLLMLLLAVRDLRGVGFNKFIIVGIVAITCVLINFGDLLAYATFLIPLSSGIPGNFCFLALAIVYLLKKGTFDSGKVFIPLFFIIQEVFLTFFAVGFNITNLMTYCINLAFVYLVILDENDKRIDYKKTLWTYLIGTLFMLAIIFFIAVKNSSFLEVVSGEKRIGYAEENTSGLVFGTNANTVGFYALMGISIALYMISEGYKFRLFTFLAIGICLFVGVLSVSRSFIIFLVLLLVIFAIKTFKPKFTQVLKLLAFIAFFTILVVVIINNTKILDAYIERFQGEDLEGANGRLDIMIDYFKWQIVRPLRFFFGTGTVSYVATAGFKMASHNGTHQILICYGLIGFVVMIGSLIHAFKLSKGKKKLTILQAFPLLAFVCFVQTVQFLNPQEYFMSLIIIFFAIRARKIKSE